MRILPRRNRRVVRKTTRQRKTYRLWFESLEDRWAPSITANPDTYAATTGQELVAGSVLANDVYDQSAMLNVTLESGPSHGTISLNGLDGTFSYTSADNFSGSDGF